MAKKYGKWNVVKSLQEGGQAHTFIVHEDGESPKHKYVLKRLKNQKRLKRFSKEISAGLSLEHPNIVRIVDFEIDSDPAYLVMEYCAGGALTVHAIDRLSFGRRIEMFAQICDAVGYAHKKGIIHRDLKPDNILLRDDGLTPVVADFGICFVADDGERMTMTDEAVGPVYFMAPELEDGRSDSVVAQSDVYSLGKLLYWLLSGRTFSREKHREDAHDLTKAFAGYEYHFINELLDEMIVPKRNDRFPNGTVVAEKVRIMSERIKKDAHVVDRRVPQPCTFCGIGIYKIVVDYDYEAGKKDDARLNNFGIRPAGAPVVLAMVCDHCGNTQLFRPDMSKNPKVWRE